MPGKSVTGPRVDPRYLWIVNTEGVHVEAIEEAGKALAEPGQALVHQLEVHHVRLEVGHGVGELAKVRLEGVEREGGITARRDRVAEGGAR